MTNTELYDTFVLAHTKYHYANYGLCTIQSQWPCTEHVGTWRLLLADNQAYYDRYKTLSKRELTT